MPTFFPKPAHTCINVIKVEETDCIVVVTAFELFNCLPCLIQSISYFEILVLRRHLLLTFAVSGPLSSYNITQFTLLIDMGFIQYTSSFSLSMLIIIVYRFTSTPEFLLLALNSCSITVSIILQSSSWECRCSHLSQIFIYLTLSSGK